MTTQDFTAATVPAGGDASGADVPSGSAGTPLADYPDDNAAIVDALLCRLDDTYATMRWAHAAEDLLGCKARIRRINAILERLP